MNKKNKIQKCIREKSDDNDDDDDDGGGGGKKNQDKNKWNNHEPNSCVCVCVCVNENDGRHWIKKKEEKT